VSLNRVGVVGAGTMGRGIAQVFGQAGYRVLLIDSSPLALEQASAAIDKSLGKFAEKGKLTNEERKLTLARISTWTSVDCVAEADLVIEAIVEDLTVKRALFQQLDSLLPPAAILASNTSSISITSLGAATKRPDKVVGMHFMNPVPMMGLVEVIRGHATSPETMAAISQLCAALGKTAVESADYPGFIANRILLPMINEAIFAVMEGVGSAESVDTVMRLGASHPMGPLQLADFIGLDVCLAILNVLHEGLGDSKYRACPLLRRMVAAGQLGRKSGRGFYTY
jgi:3-hydroxybutyryl-CoA dehydrogenase